MEITKALIIDEPWISKILSGEKTWEMRSRNAHHRGYFALIKKGTGKIFGIAKMVDSKGPFLPAELERFSHFHQIPQSMIELPDYKWNHAWILSSAVALEEPIPYTHQSGQVTWVELSVAEQESLRASLPLLQDSREGKNKPQVNLSQIKKDRVDLNAESGHVASSRPLMVPMAKDGTKFDQRCCNGRGVYTVGEKGDEKKFTDFPKALLYLEKMPKAKWRRPNSNNNWGIVSAVDWVAM